jgi:hypothetical protein
MATFTYSISTTENMEEALREQNMETYLTKYIQNNNKFGYCDSAGSWACHISKEDDCNIYKLKLIVSHKLGEFERY